MNTNNLDLIYDFHVKELSQTEALKQFTDHAVKEVKLAAGWDADVQVHIQPQAKDKRLFSVSMSVFGSQEPVVVKKEGKQVMTVLRKVKKAVLRQIHNLHKKRVSVRRKNLYREQFAS